MRSYCWDKTRGSHWNQICSPVSFVFLPSGHLFQFLLLHKNMKTRETIFQPLTYMFHPLKKGKYCCNNFMQGKCIFSHISNPCYSSFLLYRAININQVGSFVVVYFVTARFIQLFSHFIILYPSPFSCIYLFGF